MEGTVFHISSVMFNLQPLKLFSPLPIFPPRKLPSLQALKFPRRRNLPSDQRDIGDCVLFEDGIFEDTNLQNDNRTINKPKHRSKKKMAVTVSENLVPDKWRENKPRETEAEINITNNEKKKKKKRPQKMELKKGKVKPRDLDINWDGYRASKKAKLAQLKPLVLVNPSTFMVKEKVPDPDLNGERVDPKNPREVVYGKGLECVTEFFNSETYKNTARVTQGLRKMFTITKQEMVLLNKRMPDLEAATSGKWLPLHTLVACGELYLLDSLLKHNVDINAVDKDGLTVLHKAIGKKPAVTNYLLSNSADPFVQDKEGATLLHYAVQTASPETIELLLLYNVDINLQDKDGWTPLHLAVQTKRPDLVRLLLIKGADKTLRNKDGLTSLDLCLYSGQSFQTYVLIKLLKAASWASLTCMANGGAKEQCNF